MPDPPVWIYRTQLPIPQPVQFEQLVRNIDATSAATLRKITELRSLYASGVLSGSSLSAVQGAEGYHPHLLGVLQALDSISPEMVKNVKVKWSLPLNATETAEVPSLRFDHSMLLVSLGLAHRSHASDLLRGCAMDVNSADYKNASAELSIAAGIFEYCSKQPLMAWAGMSGQSIVELNPAFFHAMVELSLMEAQTLAVRKGIVSGVGLGVINKLISGVVDHADRCKNFLADARRAFQWDIPAIATMQRYILLFGQCYRSYMFYRLGQEANKESSFGLSVCYAKQGAIPAEVDQLLTDPKTSADMPSFMGIVSPVFENCRKLFAEWEKDNTNIYFERVPPAAENPPPPAAFLSKVTPYAEPYAIPPQIYFQQSMCLVM